MSLPVLNVAVDFENNGTYRDVSAYLQHLEVTRGSTRVESPIIRYEAGTAVLTLDNSDRRFDPTNLTGPYTIPSGTPGSGVQQAIANKTLLYGFGFTVAVQSTDPEVAEASLRSSSIGSAFGPTSYTVGKPSGTVSGDILIAFQTSDWGTANQIGTPTGGGTWLPLTSRTQGSYTLHTKVWWKVAGGSEPSNYTFSQGVDSDGITVIACIRDASGTPVFDSTNNNGTAFFDTPGVTPGGTADFELRYVSGTAGGDDGVSWDWSGTDGPYTELQDRQDDFYTTVSLAAKSLSGLASATGGTLVKPMRPVRVRAIWDAPGTSTNLADNPGFETNTTGWAAGSGSSLTRVSSPTPPSGGGSWIGQVSKTGAASGNIHYVECQGVSGASGTSGKHIFLSAWVRIPSASLSKITGVALAATGVTATFVRPVGATTFTADTWQRIELATVLTADVDNVQIQFWTDGTHATSAVVGYLDDVHVEISEHDLFTGYVDSWNIEWTGPNSSVVEVPCTDAFKIFSNIERTAVAAVGAGEASGTRIGRILNGISWPSSKRSIATGNVNVQATTLDGNVLEEMQLTADTEMGELYMDGSGNVIFRNRSAILTDSRSTDSQATFGDADPELRYANLSFTNDDTQLTNRVIITRVGGAVQQADDTASQAEFLVRAFERSDLIMVDNASALNYAQYLLSLSAQPELRFTDLEILPMRDETNLFPQVLNRLIGDRITVRRRPPGGGTIEQDCFVRGVTHEASPGGPWVTRWTLQSTAAGGSFFIIGHSTLGRLNDNPLGF